MNKPSIFSLNKHAGMTLLEVIVALAVFSIAAVSVTKSLSEQMANMPILEERTLAQWVASNQMVDIRLTSDFPDIGKKEGQVELAGREWYWRQEVVKTTDDKFRMITVSVSDDNRYQRIVAQVSSYVHSKL
ncbi:type II secretion system minor pseudopilin GspI [Shewanella inventionis]|uniref:Type II secretion system protein I n=1 Tax=Shewanella inventionis TaxID=1738770 RepID=A0ABQ1JPK2_9GAMM|nr:type II secretion system minor pseudopilin GspI [Shewanella inventionis]MCL1159121.1 type II secretion system minor pseudopilin GspI [Shewanella inventionis]GGB71650.1 type II secretion system protein GspI [Shewanella inventionis]